MGGEAEGLAAGHHPAPMAVSLGLGGLPQSTALGKGRMGVKERITAVQPQDESVA